MSSQIEQHRGTLLHLRACAKALITDGDSVLLVKEQHDDGSEFWTFPGGGLQESEAYTDALSRELFEELRCDVAIQDLLTTSWYAHTSCQTKLSQWAVFRCQLTSDVTTNPSEGILEYQWVKRTDLPPQTLLQVRYLLQRLTR